MMQSMVESPIPTRAEVLDVANAVLDGTDAVMLSGETASGKHPDKAVAAMRRVCEGAERQFEPKENYNFSRRLDRVDQAVSLAAIFMTGHIGVRAIIALTESGGTAQWLSRYRSRVPIYALSRRQGARRRMMLYRDVTPIAFDPMGVDANHAAFAAVQHMFNMNCLAEGDRVILTTGDHTGQHGGTNTLKLLRVGPGGVAEGLGDL
jgi:pyruvate kinase